ncbi:HlyD family efflux transporter periplasmic adaptor subunit [Massilia sp. CCM 8734]|uniref:HlyD family secretion protein n=1 Tax=Massilia sp. CCM 8734 TaxID=2609283 RepID=UPI00141E79A9|nr:HlyD family efflux transporter periplasmic adaptor subunit [Massilia sp. CCM 8734]
MNQAESRLDQHGDDQVCAHNPDRAHAPPEGLFRSEAVQSLNQRFGSPVRVFSVGGWALTGFFISALAATLVFLVTNRYARKETVFGQITPVAGSFRITAQNAGIAAQLLIKEGDIVKAGDPLISISSNPMMESGEYLAAGLKTIQLSQRQAQERQASARLQQIERQTEEAVARRDGLNVDLARLSDAVTLLERRRALQVQNLEANRSLQAQGMVSAAAVRHHEDALLGIDQQIQQAERSAALQKNQVAQTVPQLLRLSAEADFARSEAAALKAQMSERQLTSDAQLSRKLIAPINGTVTALQIRSGSAIAVGQTLAIIVPQSGATTHNQLEVELWAPSKAIGFVKPGARVRLMYDAFPYQTFGVGEGVVKDISGAPVMPSELNIPIESREQLFRIRVSLKKNSLSAYEREWGLVPGMRLSADLILEDQSLLDWLLNPLRAMQKRSS